MFNWLRKSMLKLSITAKGVIASVVSLLIFASLAPTALDALASYTPSDATTLVVWGLVGMLFVLSVALSFLNKL